MALNRWADAIHKTQYDCQHQITLKFQHQITLNYSLLKLKMNIKKKNIRSDRTERILDKGHDMGSTGIVDTGRVRQITM